MVLHSGKRSRSSALGTPMPPGASSTAADSMPCSARRSRSSRKGSSASYDAADIPIPGDHLAAASDGTYLYAIGGRKLEVTTNTAAVQRFDPAADQWTQLPAMPSPVSDSAQRYARSPRTTACISLSDPYFVTGYPVREPDYVPNVRFLGRDRVSMLTEVPLPYMGAPTSPGRRRPCAGSRSAS